MADKVIWGIHAGAGGKADSLFIENTIVAIGWSQMGDLSDLTTREQIRNKYLQDYPNASQGRIGIHVGQLFRFRSEMKIGDLIVYPSVITRDIHIGEIVGDYQYQPAIDSKYPNHRSVKWLEHTARKKFSQGALYEIGAAMTLFQIKNYADEFLAALQSQLPEVEQIEDTTVSFVASDVEELTRDFVLKQLFKNLKGLPLEEFIVHLLEKMGYRARLTRTNEPSLDIIAHKDELGFEPPIVKVQVKSSDDKIGDRDVSALYGKVERDEFGLLIALGDFSARAVQFANNKSNLRLVNGTELVDLIFEHYEEFDSKYKSIIPLKNVYVPEAVEKEE